MGQTHSVLFSPRPRGEPVAWWHCYTKQEWRSSKSRELDELGGLNRRALARGESFEAKLGYLGETVLQRADKYESMLDKSEITYNTDGQPVRGGVDNQYSFTRQPSLRKNSREDVMHSLSQHEGSFTSRNQRGTQAGSGGHSSANGRGSMNRRQGSKNGRVEEGEHTRSSEATNGDSPPGTVAPWRLRVHDARRRAFLVVRTAIRFRAGLKHPTRLRRVDSFSFTIPQLLGQEMTKVIEEQKAALTARSGVETCTAMMLELDRGIAEASRRAWEAEQAEAREEVARRHARELDREASDAHTRASLDAEMAASRGHLDAGGQQEAGMSRTTGPEFARLSAGSPGPGLEVQVPQRGHSLSGARGEPGSAGNNHHSSASPGRGHARGRASGSDPSTHPAKPSPLSRSQNPFAVAENAPPGHARVDSPEDAEAGGPPGGGVNRHGAASLSGRQSKELATHLSDPAAPSAPADDAEREGTQVQGRQRTGAVHQVHNHRAQQQQKGSSWLPQISGAGNLVQGRSASFTSSHNMQRGAIVLAAGGSLTPTGSGPAGSSSPLRGGVLDGGALLHGTSPRGSGGLLSGMGGVGRVDSSGSLAGGGSDGELLGGTSQRRNQGQGGARKYAPVMSRTALGGPSAGGSPVPGSSRDISPASPGVRRSHSGANGGSLLTGSLHAAAQQRLEARVLAGRDGAGAARQPRVRGLLRASSDNGHELLEDRAQGPGGDEEREVAGYHHQSRSRVSADQAVVQLPSVQRSPSGRTSQPGNSSSGQLRLHNSNSIMRESDGSGQLARKRGSTAGNPSILSTAADQDAQYHATMQFEAGSLDLNPSSFLPPISVRRSHDYSENGSALQGSNSVGLQRGGSARGSSYNGGVLAPGGASGPMVLDPEELSSVQGNGHTDVGIGGGVLGTIQEGDTPRESVQSALRGSLGFSEGPQGSGEGGKDVWGMYNALNSPVNAAESAAALGLDAAHSHHAQQPVNMASSAQQLQQHQQARRERIGGGYGGLLKQQPHGDRDVSPQGPGEPVSLSPAPPTTIRTRQQQSSPGSGRLAARIAAASASGGSSGSGRQGVASRQLGAAGARSRAGKAASAGQLRIGIGNDQSGGAVADGPPGMSDRELMALHLETKKAKESEAVAHAARLQKAELMLGMYINRSNAGWVESLSWGAPRVWDLQEQARAAAAGRLRGHYEAATSLLRKGAVGFMILACEDALSHSSGGCSQPQGPGTPGGRAKGNGSSGASSMSGAPTDAFAAAPRGPPPGASDLQQPQGALDVWTSDPYDIISAMRPGMLKHRACIKGWSTQARALTSLAVAMQSLGGPEAVSKTVVVLALTDEQAEEATHELWSHKFFGLTRSNVILLVQNRRAPYKYDATAKAWVQDPTSPPYPLGTGLSAMQLSWVPDAYCLNEDGLPTPIGSTALELMTQRGISWLMSWRARDLGLFGPSDQLLLGQTGTAGAAAMAAAAAQAQGSGAASWGGVGLLIQALACREMYGAHIVTAASLSDQLAAARSADSVLLAPMQQQQPDGQALAGRPSMGGFTHPPTTPITTTAIATSGLEPRAPGGEEGPGGEGSGQHPLAGGPSSPGSGHSSGTGGGSTPASRPTASGSSGAAAGLQGVGGGSRWACCELSMAETSTPRMFDMLAQVKASAGGRIAIGLGRYALHVPSIKAALSGSHDAKFRPKLRLTEGGLLHVGLSIADLSCFRGMRCVAVEAAPLPRPASAAAGPPVPASTGRDMGATSAAGGPGGEGRGSTPGAKLPLLLSPTDLDTLLPLCMAQDNDRALMSALERSAPAVAEGSGGGGSSGPSWHSAHQSQGPLVKRNGNCTVVFVDGGHVGLLALRMALALARPGIDTVNLVIFVGSEMAVEGGRGVLARVLDSLGFRPSVELRLDVIVKHDSGLLDCMAGYLDASGADLLVLGSHRLTAQNAHLVIGSIALAAIKRLQVPVLILTPNASKTIESLAERRMAKLMGLVDGTSAGDAGLLAYMTERLMSLRRGDKMSLCQVYTSRHLTRQQEINMRRYMADADSTCTARGAPATHVVIDSPVLEDAVGEAVDEGGVHVVGVQLMAGAHTIPPAVMGLIKHSRAAILLYRGRPGSPASVLQGHTSGAGSEGSSAPASEASGHY